MSIGLGGYKFTFEEKPAPTPQGTALAGASSDKPSVPPSLSEGDLPAAEANESAFHPIWELNKAIDERDRSGIEAAFAKLRANPPWDISSEERDAWEQSALLRAGFSGALDKLKRTESEDARNPYPSRYLGRYYLRIKELHEAQTHAQNAIDRASSDEDMATSYLLMAEILKEKEGDLSSIRFLINQIKNLRDKREISRIYAEIGDLQKASGENNFALASYELAIRAEAHNSTARFNAAYLASTEETSRLISLRHYQIYLASNVGNTVATNNLAVLYGELKLPISKVRHWRLAQKNDDGFATGNLAIALTDAGFIDEAQKELDSAPEAIKNHTRMLDARSYLDAERKKDQQNREDLIIKAEKTWQRLRPWECDLRIANEDCVGEWRSKEGKTLTVGKNAHKFSIEIIDGEFKIWAQTWAIAGISTFTAERDLREKKTNSLLGSIYSASSGAILSCVTSNFIRMIFLDGVNVMEFEFSKTAL